MTKKEPVDRKKALETALAKIKKDYGEDSVSLFGDKPLADLEVIPTGSLSLDIALGVGGYPKGRIIETWGPEASGKCLTKDTMIWTQRGLETIEEVFNYFGHEADNKVQVTDVSAENFKIVNENGELERLDALTHNGEQEVLRVTLTNGQTITGTRNHPVRVFVEGGTTAWKNLEDLESYEDLVVTASHLRIPQGLICSDLTIEEGHLCGDTAVDEVPRMVRLASAEVRKAFLASLFRGDAEVRENGHIILFCPTERLARETQQLLLGFGIASDIADLNTNPKTGETPYAVNLDYVAAHQFVNKIGLRSAVQRKAWDAWQDKHVDLSTYEDELVTEGVFSVENLGLQPTFDVALGTTHSFISNGIISHNTTLALHAIAECQKQGGTAAFIDAEHALDPVYATNLGVDMDSVIFSQPANGEEALNIVETLASSGGVDLIVVDSVAALIPKAELDGDVGDQKLGLQARMMSQAMRKLTSVVSKQNTVVMFINQLRMKIGVMFGSPETTTGGNALKYYASQRLDIRRIGSIKENDKQVGGKTRVKVVKNKVAPPFREVEFDIRFGVGIDSTAEIVDLAVEAGLMEKSGSWYSYLGERIGQGREKVIELVDSDESLRDALTAKIRELHNLKS